MATMYEIRCESNADGTVAGVSVEKVEVMEWLEPFAEVFGETSPIKRASVVDARGCSYIVRADSLYETEEDAWRGAKSELERIYNRMQSVVDSIAKAISTLRLYDE